MIGITEKGDAGLDRSWTHWVYDEKKPAILITKAPSKLISTNVLTSMEVTPNVIVHCTITGYGGTFMEPNVKPPQEELAAYTKLCDILGTRRVVLRIDPIIPTEKGIDKALDIYHEKVKGGRKRISFLDGYNHTRERIINTTGFDLPWIGIHAPLEKRIKIHEQCFPEAEVCGEPGMSCTGCISTIDCSILGVKPVAQLAGQRKACKCLSLKNELLSNKTQCHHGCLYCYWK